LDLERLGRPRQAAARFEEAEEEDVAGLGAAAQARAAASVKAGRQAGKRGRGSLTEFEELSQAYQQAPWGKHGWLLRVEAAV